MNEEERKMYGTMVTNGSYRRAYFCLECVPGGKHSNARSGVLSDGKHWEEALNAKRVQKACETCKKVDYVFSFRIEK